MPPNETPPSLLDTISSAISEVTPSAAVETPDANSEAPVVEPTDSGAADDSPASGGNVDGAATDGGAEGATDDVAPTGDDGDGEVDENDPEAVKAAEAAGRTRDPATGKFTKKAEPTAEEKAATEAAAAAKAAADAAAAKKPPDAINDPIPKELNKKTQERIRTLVEVAKEADKKVAKAVEERDFVLQRVIDSTATPEQFDTLLNITRLVNSADPKEKKQALEYFQQAAAEMAHELGVVLPGVDVLAEHADLKQKVELGHIPRKDAEELAAMRNAQGHAARSREQQAAAQREQQQRAQEVANAKAALNALEETLKNDPHYAAKSRILIPMMQETFKHVPPSQWAATFQANYNKLPAPVAPRPTLVQNKPTDQPLRARTGAGGQVKAPGSMLEAINAGIAAASSR